ncbi:MAG: hypothetical protein K2L25_01405 [Alphaproteobacteria bacterium]|nr:hypothetical protein [Alphaproteobacteria bacterium]
MNTKQIRLKFRDAINKITGKDVLIKEFYSLSRRLCEISDRTPVGTPLKKQIMNSIDSILEQETVYTQHGFYIDSYDPYKGSKATTQKKIEALKMALESFTRLQNVR